jgi:NTP pyrophosphatase (non-canonical NTP hydrolase)
MTTSDWQYWVQQFHEMNDLPVNTGMCTERSRILVNFARRLRVEAEAFEEMAEEDQRNFYAHLIAEEFGEFVMEMAEGREDNAAHELADVIFSCLGFAVLMGWDMDAIFMAVANANLMKERDPAEFRVRARGKHYRSPIESIKHIIKKGKENATLRGNELQRQDDGSEKSDAAPE